MLNWLRRKVEHLIAKALIKEPTWHVLLCNCEEKK